MKEQIQAIEKMVTEKADQKFINTAIIDILALMAVKSEEQQQEINRLKELGSKGATGGNAFSIG